MAKDILLIGFIGQYNVMFFYDQINEATKDDPGADMILRVNSEGGNPDYSESIIEKAQELADQIYIRAGAMAHSTALFLMAYIPVERVECVDTTQALLHRAAYYDWLERSDDFKGSPMEAILIKVNKDLEKAFRARVDVEILEALPQMVEKNLKLKDIFSLEARNEVILTGADLKKIGLVSKVNKITPTREASMKAEAQAFTGCNSLSAYRAAAAKVIEPEKTDEPKKENKSMTLAELKEKFPAIYTEAVKIGVDQEKDRIEAALVYVDVDPEGVKKAIEAGTAISAKQMAEWNRKSASSATLDTLKKDSPKDVTTSGADATKTEKEQKQAAFLGEVDASIKQVAGK